MNAYERFIHKFKDLRKLKGLNQDDVAKKAGISKVQLARYETLQIPSGMPLPVAMRLAEVLGSRLEFLIAGDITAARVKLHGLIDLAPEKDLKVISGVLEPIIQSRIQDKN